MHYEVTYKQVIGSRSDQEDSFGTRLATDAVFAVVCDGMGGLGNGRAASQAAVQKMLDLYDNRSSDEQASMFFLRAMDLIDECVVNLPEGENGRSQSGTTVVAVLVENGMLHWFSVGDSRLYIIRGDEMVQTTRDHNYALSLELWSDEELPGDVNDCSQRRKDALISYIGIGGVKIFDVNEVPFVLQAGDRLLLTTDGLYKLLGDKQVFEVLHTTPAPESLDVLFAQAAHNVVAAQDNTTCVLIDCLTTGGSA